MEFIYDVYVRTNKNNKVTKVFSTCFEQPREGDILIKSGSGDEYVHVQGMYQIYDKDGNYKYKVVGNKIVECTEEDNKIFIQRKEIMNQMSDIKRQLNDTDYKTLKYIDGDLSEEEYESIKNIRVILRKEYNNLEKELAILSVEE